MESLTEKKILDFKNAVKGLANGMVMVSETDEPLRYIEFGNTGDEEELILKIKGLYKPSEELKIKTSKADFFFKNLVKVEDWFENEEKEIAEKFKKLKKLLEENLKNLKVFKIGKTEQDIFILGKLDNQTWAGVKTKNVET